MVPTGSPLTVPAALALDPFGSDVRAAIDLAARAGFSGVALGMRHPALRPEDMGATARRHLLRTISARGLQLSCLRTGAGVGGIFDPATVDRCVAEAIAAIHLARDLKSPTVSVYIGEPTPASGEATAWHGVVDALASQADRAGIQLALSSGAITPLVRVLAELNTPSVRANLDTLRIFAGGGDMESAVTTLAGRIGLWTCADAVRGGNSFRPVELGSGQAHPEKILAMLRELDFTGPIVADVRDLPDPVGAATHAAAVLRAAM